jgi:hypothetical protein
MQLELQAIVCILIAWAAGICGNRAWVNVSLALEKAQSEGGALTNGTLKRLLNDCRVPISDVVGLELLCLRSSLR